MTYLEFLDPQVEPDLETQQAIHNRRERTMPRVPAGTVPAEPVRLATPGQVKYLTDLYAERELRGLGPIPEPLTFDQARKGILWLKASPRKAKPVAKLEPTEGLWVEDTPEGIVAYWVKPTKNGLGWNVREWVPNPEDTETHGEWVYVGGRSVLTCSTNGNPLRPATKEEGEQFALAFNHCYKCSRLLTVTSSRAIGMGPDCAGKAGL